jgi:hypothetical protein
MAVKRELAHAQRAQVRRAKGCGRCGMLRGSWKSLCASANNETDNTTQWP